MKKQLSYEIDLFADSLEIFIKHCSPVTSPTTPPHESISQCCG